MLQPWAEVKSQAGCVQVLAKFRAFSQTSSPVHPAGISPLGYTWDISWEPGTQWSPDPSLLGLCFDSHPILGVPLTSETVYAVGMSLMFKCCPCLWALTNLKPHVTILSFPHMNQFICRTWKKLHLIISSKDHSSLWALVPPAFEGEIWNSKKMPQ